LLLINAVYGGENGPKHDPPEALRAERQEARAYEKTKKAGSTATGLASHP
jgi:hypothetical protein